MIVDFVLKMNPLQLRLARTALDLTVRDAADFTGVSHNSITRYERGLELKESTVAKMRAALEAAGVIFVEENGDGPGVRLRKRAS